MWHQTRMSVSSYCMCTTCLARVWYCSWPARFTALSLWNVRHEASIVQDWSLWLHRSLRWGASAHACVWAVILLMSMWNCHHMSGSPYTPRPALQLRNSVCHTHTRHMRAHWCFLHILWIIISLQERGSTLSIHYSSKEKAPKSLIFTTQIPPVFFFPPEE